MHSSCECTQGEGDDMHLLSICSRAWQSADYQPSLQPALAASWWGTAHAIVQGNELVDAAAVPCTACTLLKVSNVASKGRVSSDVTAAGKG